MNDGDDGPDIQDAIDEYLELIERELRQRDAAGLYEKYGSTITPSLQPLWAVLVTSRANDPVLVYEFLKEFFK